MPSATKSNSPLAQLFKEPGANAALKKGEVVTAVYIGKTQHAHFFDLGRAGTGIVYGLELINAYEAMKAVKPGDGILAKIADPENADGYAELSISETSKHKAWAGIQEMMDRGEPIKVKVAGANTGGLIVPVSDVKAFLPVSQLSADHYPRVADGDRIRILDELKKLVGAELTVKIIDFNPRTAKLIVSERGVLDENTKESIAKYKAGDVVKVIVSGVADFGAFVKFADDLNVEGLIHISEIDHRLIEDPREAVAVNDALEAKIVEIKDGRISLSLKALRENPWDKAGERYAEGQVAEGTVHRFNQLGAVVKLDADFQGLVRATDFGGVEEMQKALSVGAARKFVIEAVKPAEKRIMLKLAETK